MVQEIQAGADEEEYAAHKDQEMHDAGIRLAQEPDVERTVQDAYLDELADALDRVVETLVRLAQHPHLVAPVHRISDQRDGGGRRQVNAKLY